MNMKAKIIFGILLLAVCSAGMSLAAQTSIDPNSIFYVSSSTTIWSTSVTSSSYTDPQQAIADAHTWSVANGKQAYVLVTLGTFNAPTTSFSMANGVTIIGGFDGTETGMIPSTNLQDQSISGTTNTVFYGNGQVQVFVNNDLDETATLINAVIAAGYTSAANGAGMSNTNSNPTIIDCTFSVNINVSASYYGGGMSNSYSNPTITNCTFVGNRCSIGGGGMYNTYSSPKVINCLFLSNTLTGTAYGGGMLNVDGANPMVFNCVFNDNSSWMHGGAVFNTNNCSSTFINCTMANCYANSSNGGDVFMSGSGCTTTLINCIFALNGHGTYTNFTTQVYLGGTVTIRSCVNGTDWYDDAGNVHNNVNPALTDFNSDWSLTSSATWAIKQGEYETFNTNITPVLVPIITALGASLTATTLRDINANVIVSGAPGSETIDLGAFRYIDTGEESAVFDAVPPVPVLSATVNGSPYTSGALTNADVTISVSFGDLTEYIYPWSLQAYNWVAALKNTITEPTTIAGDYTAPVVASTSGHTTYTFVCVSPTGNESSPVSITTYIDKTSAVTDVTPSGGDEAPVGAIVITFSKAIATTGTVSLNGGAPLAGGSWDTSKTVYTLPYSGLDYSTTYTVNISGFKDLAGNVMAADNKHSFTTQEIPVAGVTLTATGGNYSTNDITLTATVTTAGAGIQGQAYKPAPTGTVTFREGNVTLGIKTLNGNGVATYLVPSLIDPGSYTFTAEYSGDTNHTGAVSDSCTVDVSAFLSVAPAALNFDASGGMQPVTIECTAGWSLSCDAQWVTATVSESESTDTHIVLDVTATANPDAAQRKALITVSIPGVMIKTVSVAQDAGVNPSTGLQATGTPSTTVYSQAGNVVVKSDTPIQSVAVYDISGKMLKSVKGGNTIVTINGLPRQQVLVVKVTDGGERSYKLRIEN